VVHPAHTTPIKYVYYTEGDQVVRFRDERIKDGIAGEPHAVLTNSLAGISSVLNETLYILGRRRQKARDSPAVEYMDGLDDGRSCGQGSYYYYSQNTSSSSAIPQNTSSSSASCCSNYVFALD